jgi:predicted ABC-type ATPase
MKKILIIAGPNGAGKTTFAEEFLPNEADCPEFVNADLIAAGSSSGSDLADMTSPATPSAAALPAGCESAPALSWACR